jgi:copper chaperone CopZ
MKKTITYNTPVLYGDHHVVEVRCLLKELPGIDEIYASSAFRIVEVAFDTELISETQISQVLDEAGYLGDWSMPSETGRAVTEENDRALTFFRHTEVYETSREVISFAQRVNYSGKPLWNCPGFGVIKQTMEE